MILTTTPTIEGQTIREYKGVVTGETIIGANIIRDFFAGIRDVVGGRSGSYEEVLRQAKETSLKEMMSRAQRLGANAVVGIDIDYETIGNAFSKGSPYKSLIDFLNDCRLTRAAKLLTEQPDLSIADIARQSGFARANTLTANFKQRYTLTPTQYREQQTK